MKKQVRLAPSVGLGLLDNPSEIVKIREGSVTLWDRAKAYYKAMIAAVGTLALMLQQATPVFDGVLAGSLAQKVFAVAVSVVTVAGVVLRENEHWFDA